MGLQCSILGHAFDPAGVEREREEQGSEVVTTEREIQRCSRCGNERVVSESTEVTAVVDAVDVGLESDSEGASELDVDESQSEPQSEPEPEPEAEADPEPESVLGGIVDRSDAAEKNADTTADHATEPDTMPSDEPEIDIDEEPPNPDEEDAEILTDDTDDDPERQPGQWPDDLDADPAENGDEDEAIEFSEPRDESLSGITVPQGNIICPDCPFSVEANSGYRGGDPCPECNAWLEAERNQ